MPRPHVRTTLCWRFTALLVVSMSCRAPWNPEDVTLADAETLAALEAQRLGYDTQAMRQECDATNSQWRHFVAVQNTEGREYPAEGLRATLAAEGYWAIHFGPTGETARGGDLWLFISRSSGACVGLIPEQ